MDWFTVINPIDAAITLTAPAVIYGTSRANRRKEDRRLLSNQIDIFLTPERLQQIDRIFTLKKERIAVDPELQALALNLLLPLQRIARSISDSPRHWEAAIDHHCYHRLSEMIGQCSTLLVIIRQTNLAIDFHAWNGHRSKAFDALLRAFRIKLPKW